MSFTSTDLSRVEQAILSLGAGDAVVQVTFGNGYSVRYREADMDKLIQLRSLIQRETSGVHRRVHAYNAGRCRS
jgi:hypothetical protein